MPIDRKQKKNLGLLELVAIALGGMVGGGIFTVIGVSVAMIGDLTPAAIFIGGIVALLAAYSYVKLGVYYKDEGATFSFIKRTFTESHTASSIIGWWVIFGYISTLALYAYTFASYILSGSGFAQDILVRKAVAIGITVFFAVINIWSVKGMGKIEDIMVYTKFAILLAISVILIKFGSPNLSNFIGNISADAGKISVLSILIVASITFVAYEGFQLVINAVEEMHNPDKTIPRAIYLAIFLVIIIYIVISFGAVLTIPAADIIQNKEFALAYGAGQVIGSLGADLVILGAILATSSAISGTLFGASRQMAVISENGYLPRFLSVRKKRIPVNAIIIMAGISSLLILIGGLELILEFGSITFLLVSLLVAYTNFTIRRQTKSSSFLTVLSIIVLAVSGILILYYEFTHALPQMLFIIFLYIVLTIGALTYARKKSHLGVSGGRFS